MDDIEQQVERALAAFNKLKVPASWDDELLPIFRDLLAGKFKEEPLPEIVRQPWMTAEPHVMQSNRKGGCFYVVSSGNCNDFDCTGPDAKTAREAIDTWNAAFGKRDEP